MEDFLLLEEQLSHEERLMRDAVQRFVQTTVMPKIAAAYEAAMFPAEFIQGLAELGVFGMTLPEQYGGLGAGAVSYGLVCQELEKGDSGLRSFVSVQSSLSMYPIFAYGSEEQKQKWLPAMAQGKVIGCFGLTEPDHGSDPAGMETTAHKVPGGWQLQGRKMWITNATIADIAIVWAKVVPGEEQNSSGENIRGFIIERNCKGFTTTEIKHKLSLRASITGELVLEDCFVPDSHYLPGSAIGIRAPLGCLTQARYGIAWGAIGAAQACYESALNYSLTRQQFSKPIASFQLVQKELVEMFAEIVKAQCYNLQLGRLKEAERCTYAMVSLGKMNACKQALAIARSARSLLGANGISLEYPIIRHMANLESVATYEGTDNIHHLILGKHITGISAFN